MALDFFKEIHTGDEDEEEYPDENTVRKMISKLRKFDKQRNK